MAVPDCEADDENMPASDGTPLAEHMPDVSPGDAGESLIICDEEMSRAVRSHILGDDLEIEEDEDGWSEKHPHVPMTWATAVQIRGGMLNLPYPEDFYGPGFAPERPTRAAPGSIEKIAILTARYQNREHLHHPADFRDRD